MNARGLVYRERAAKVAYKLAFQRSQSPLDGCSGRASGEHGNRNSGHLTSPGWGRVKRKRQAEDEESEIEYQRPSFPLPHIMSKSVSVSSLSELVNYLTTQDAAAESRNGRTETPKSSADDDAKKAKTIV
mmetsp:Transcript_67122/g.135292  ORF Transcript_67122/g.135292 Transcript_67122/m.135292 type:complete len:130 (+) Transcript_67122:68-457(+)